MGTYFGDKKISQMYYGDKKIKEAYYGSRLVYQSVRSVYKEVSDVWTGTWHIKNENQWYTPTSDVIPMIRIGPYGTENFSMIVTATIPRAWGFWELRLNAGSQILAQVTREGSSGLIIDKTLTHTIDAYNVSLPPNALVTFSARRWSNNGREGITKLDYGATWTQLE